MWQNNLVIGQFSFNNTLSVAEKSTSEFKITNKQLVICEACHWSLTQEKWVKGFADKIKNSLLTFF